MNTQISKLSRWQEVSLIAVGSLMVAVITAHLQMPSSLKASLLAQSNTVYRCYQGDGAYFWTTETETPESSWTAAEWSACGASSTSGTVCYRNTTTNEYVYDNYRLSPHWTSADTAQCSGMNTGDLKRADGTIATWGQRSTSVSGSGSSGSGSSTSGSSGSGSGSSGSSGSWVQKTWTFKDGGTTTSYILNRTDSEYTNYIDSVYNQCIAINQSQSQWNPSAGDDSASNWQNFGIPDCSGTATSTGGGGGTTSSGSWVNKTWRFKDGGTTTSYILNRTDSEYTNYINSIYNQCLTINNNQFQWKTGAGDDSSSNWQNFGIPDCSGTATSSGGGGGGTGGGTTSSGSSWGQKTWRFKDGGTSTSAILSRTDSEYTNYIDSIYNQCLTINQSQFQWKTGAGDSSSSNWQNFGIPDCSAGSSSTTSTTSTGTTSGSTGTTTTSGSTGTTTTGTTGTATSTSGTATTTSGTTGSTTTTTGTGGTTTTTGSGGNTATSGTTTTTTGTGTTTTTTTATTTETPASSVYQCYQNTRYKIYYWFPSADKLDSEWVTADRTKCPVNTGNYVCYRHGKSGDTIYDDYRLGGEWTPVDKNKCADMRAGDRKQQSDGAIIPWNEQGLKESASETSATVKEEPKTDESSTESTATEITAVSEGRPLSSELKMRVEGLKVDLARFQAKGEAAKASLIQGWIKTYEALLTRLQNGEDIFDEIKTTDEEVRAFFETRHEEKRDEFVEETLKRMSEALKETQAKVAEGAPERCAAARTMIQKAEGLLEEAQSFYDQGDFERAAKFLDRTDQGLGLFLGPSLARCLTDGTTAWEKTDVKEVFGTASGVDEATIEKITQEVTERVTARIQFAVDEHLKEAAARVATLEKVARGQVSQSLEALQAVEERYRDVMAETKKEVIEKVGVLEDLAEATKTALRDQDREKLYSVLETVSTYNWCGRLGEELQQETNDLVSSFESGSIRQADVKAFEKEVTDAAKRNGEACYQAGVSRFRDNASHEWYFGAFQDERWTGTKTSDGRLTGNVEPGREALAAEAMLTVMRSAGYRDIEGQCATQNGVADSASVPSWASCAANVAAAVDVLPEGALNQPIERQDVADMIVRVLEEKGLEAASLTQASSTEIDQTLASYKDLSQCEVPDSVIATVVQNGLMTGNPDGAWNCEGHLNRAELATILERFESMLDFYE